VNKYDMNHHHHHRLYSPGWALVSSFVWIQLAWKKLCSHQDLN